MNCPRCGHEFKRTRCRSLPSTNPDVGTIRVCRRCGHYGAVNRRGVLGRLRKALDFPETRRQDVGLTVFDLEVYATLLDWATRQNVTLMGPPPALLTIWLGPVFPLDLFAPEGYKLRSKRARHRAVLRAIAMLVRADALRPFRIAVHDPASQAQPDPPGRRFVFPEYRNRRAREG